MRTGDALKKTNHLITTVQMTSKFLSYECLNMISIALLSLIFNVYLFIDYVLASAMGSYWLTTHMGGTLYSALILWTLNVQSEDIKQSLQNIKKKIFYTW